MGCVARGRNAKPAILKDALVPRTVSGQQPAFQPRRDLRDSSPLMHYCFGYLWLGRHLDRIVWFCLVGSF